MQRRLKNVGTLDTRESESLLDSRRLQLSRRGGGGNAGLEWVRGLDPPEYGVFTLGFPRASAHIRDVHALVALGHRAFAEDANEAQSPIVHSGQEPRLRSGSG